MQKETRGALALYFKSVETTRMLSAPEVRSLVVRYTETKDPTARDLILKGALRYVIAEARKNPRSYADYTVMEDLIAAGNVGLLRALDKFDINAGTRFLTYASWWVRHEIREESRRLGLVRIPAHAVSKGTRSPGTTELSDHVTYESDSDTDHWADLHNHYSILKLLSESPLSVREVFIVKSCYGIHTASKTLKQIGNVLDITGERVRQLRESALTKLRSSQQL